jgi:signal transduction histidine kinase
MGWLDEILRNQRRSKKEDRGMDDKDYLYDLLVHDLRGPLSVVSATTNSLLDKIETYGTLTDMQKSCLLRIQRNAKKAQVILNEILDVGRSEERLFSRDSFLVSEVVRESVINALESVNGSIDEKLQTADVPEAFKLFLDNSAITVKISGRFQTERFVHDRRKVQLIIENLVSNALKYRKRAVKVEVHGDNDIVIVVSDDGAGIPLSEQSTVYGRFSQCSNAGSTQTKGLGLGLFCVRSLIESMGGAINLTSSEGNGTTFQVQIPLLDKSKGA